MGDVQEPAPTLQLRQRLVAGWAGGLLGSAFLATLAANGRWLGGHGNEETIATLDDLQVVHNEAVVERHRGVGEEARAARIVRASSFDDDF